MSVPANLLSKTEIVERIESSIDPDKPIHFITWCPDPEEMPDCDFELQHKTNIRVLADYLNCCSVGIFCVEATQRGNPHYHGWYQVDDKNELARVQMVKTLSRFGKVKIDKCMSKKVKIFSFKEFRNPLYYYKKDLCDAFLDVDDNPITRDSECSVNWETLELVDFLSVGPSRCKAHQKCATRVSDLSHWRSFYKDTLNHIGYL